MAADALISRPQASSSTDKAKEALLLNRAFDKLANGLLIYVLFYAVVWLLIGKGGILTYVSFDLSGELPVLLGPVLLGPVLLGNVAMPFSVSAVAAFLAHAGLRWGLKRLRLRLSTSESSASIAFMGVLVLFGLTGSLLDVFTLPGEHVTLTHVSVVLGAWFGAAIRRRIAI